MIRLVLALFVALYVTVLTLQPASAQSSFTARTSDDTTVISRTEMERMMRTVPIRNWLTTEPPKPQPYWKIFVSDDLKLVLVCKVDDKTDEIIYCDVYF